MLDRRDQTLNMLTPQVERSCLLGGVARAVVDAGDASLVATKVVQHGLNNVRLHT